MPTRPENRNKSKINWLGIDDNVLGFDFCNSDCAVLCHQEKTSNLLQKKEVQNICLQIQGKILLNKVGCVFLMVVVPMLPHAEFGRSDHREYALRFKCVRFTSQTVNYRPGMIESGKKS